MDTERNLLFGVVALQNGAVDADGLAETCAAWTSEATLPLADLMVDRGLLTAEQRTEVEAAVEHELAAHGGDPHATLAATLDGRSLEALGGAAGPAGAMGIGVVVAPAPPQAEAGQGGHVVLGRLSPGEHEPRDRYTLTHLHAKGGMGRVWLARDGALGRQIALKELRPDQADNAIICSRFLYEAKITAQLEHPGIVPVYELGEGDAPYYTMRFVRGRTLGEAIRAYHKKRAAGQADSVGLNDLLLAFVSVCHAVAYAHSRGIIHRDLKGQNVVLGDFGEVIVLDWGLAKRVGPDPAQARAPAHGPGAPAPAGPADRLESEAATAATCAAAPSNGAPTLPDDPDDLTALGSIPRSGQGADGGAHPNGHPTGRPVPESGAGREGTMRGQLLGTPAYMAPEQAQARHDLIDQRTDTYGLGAILYEILTGRPPFVAPKTSEIIRKVCKEEPIPPRQLAPELAPGLEAICLKALRKEKADRYQAASELAQEVRRYLADEPVVAYREPWTQRALRWVRRNQKKVVAAAVLLGTATIALAVSTALIAREQREAEAQGQQARRAVHLLTKDVDMAFDDQPDPIQKQKLESALTYYEQFTDRVAGKPAVKLEQGRDYQRMGDIERKLGRLGGSEKAYRQAIAVLEPLAGAADLGREARRSLARTRTLLADLMIRGGTDKGRADGLYRQAMEMQQALADARQSPGATAEDILRLGQTLKSRGDLLRLDGKWAEAGPAYDRAIAELERALAADAKDPEARTDLALAIDARGWIHSELGDFTPAEADFRRAVEMLEKLVTDFPTTPRHREALARALNSVAMIERDTGRLADAEVHLNRELPLAERLTQDFPDRTEYRRILARSLSNQGVVLSDQHRQREAEPVLDRAVKVNAEVLAKSPDDVQIRLDLARIQVNLGDLLREKGETERALASLRAARAINEKLVGEFPGRPRYRNLLAANLVDLALAMQENEPAEAEELYRAADGLFDKLVTANPENVAYRIGQALCRRNHADALKASTTQSFLAVGAPVAAVMADRAEATYRRALAPLEAKVTEAVAAGMRVRAEILNNLGELHRGTGRPESESIFGQALGILTDLASRPSATIKDRHNLAIAANNLGATLLALKRPAEAEAMMARAEAGYEKLVRESPKAVDYHSELGLVEEGKAEVLSAGGKLAGAAESLTKAVAHQDLAAQLSKNHPVVRARLCGHYLELARINLKRGAYQEAADDALRATRAVPEASRAQTSFDAARILAQLVGLVGADPKLVPADRERLVRPYLARSIVLLREALDSNPEMAARIKDDRDIKVLETRPEFKMMMNSLVNAGGSS
jgi:serine/threonine protein kinase